MNSPNVTVLMPVYNGEKYIREAIDSILNQTFTDFEFLIINDGSTDQSAAIILSCLDSRVRLIQNKANMGLISSLNKGLEVAQGKYIARMDADDISHPQRLEKQVRFLGEHLEVGVCGTWLQIFSNFKKSLWKPPTDYSEIKSQMIFESVIYHPTVMMRASLIKKNKLFYDDDFIHAEDYEFWLRCSRSFPLANIDEVLLYYRVHENQVSKENDCIKKHNADRIRKIQLNEIGLYPSLKQMELHRSISECRFEGLLQYLVSARQWLETIKAANDKAKIYPEPSFSKILGKRWFKLCQASTNLGHVPWKQFWSSPLASNFELDWKQKTKFGLKCVIKK